MSEHVYEFGDPIRVFINGEWQDGVYLRKNRDPDVLHCVVAKGFDFVVDRQDDEIEPRVVSRPARGWRLPEPGDVVSVHGSDNQRTIRFVDWGRPDPIQTQDGLWWYVSSCKPVRLHDAPALPPAPFEAASEASEETSPITSLDQDEVGEFIGKLEVAADLLEELGTSPSPPWVFKVKSLLIAQLIDEVAVALGADR